MEDVINWIKENDLRFSVGIYGGTKQFFTCDIWKILPNLKTCGRSAYGNSVESAMVNAKEKYIEKPIGPNNIYKK